MPPRRGLTRSAPQRKTLDPKLDIVFWMLLARERNRPLLLGVLNAVLRPSAPIEAVEVLGSEPDKAAVEGKDIVLDLRVRLASGEEVDVEMQSRWHPALRERLLYYWARLYAGQLPRGTEYTALRRSVVIVFADFDLLAGRRFHSIFQVRERHGQGLLTDQLELHVLELPKLEAAPVHDQNDEPELVGWCKFFSATTDTELEELAMQHPTLKQAKQALEELSADPHARVRAEQREMSRIAYDLTMHAARQEGITEGRAEDILSVLVARGIPVSNERSAAVRACRDLQQLDTWLRRAASAERAADVFE